MDRAFEKTSGLIQKIFEQAKDGFISLGPKGKEWTYHVKFYQKIEGKVDFPLDNSVPIVNIPNYQTFVKKIEKYIPIAKDFYKKDKTYLELDNAGFEEKLFMDLFISATNYDLNNIEQYIDKRTKMLQNPIKEGAMLMGHLGDYRLVGSIRKTSSNIEGPYKLVMHFRDKEGNLFIMPAITFGKIDDTAYVYAVQKPQTRNNDKDSPVRKKLDRYFRKVNKDVPEDMQNVSPNALVSFTVFNSLIESMGIKNIVAPDFMPIRYEANKEGALAHIFFAPEREEYLAKHDHDQYNITNKFMDLFVRYNHHFDNTEITYDDNTQTMHMTLEKSGKRLTSEEIMDRDLDLEDASDNIIYSIADIVPEQQIIETEQRRQESQNYNGVQRLINDILSGQEKTE